MELLLLPLIIFAAVIWAAIWVYNDAVARGRSSYDGAWWSVVMFLLPCVVLPLWLIIRGPRIKFCPYCGEFWEHKSSGRLFCPECDVEL